MQVSQMTINRKLKNGPIYFLIGWIFWSSLGIFECGCCIAKGPCRFIQTSAEIELYPLKCFKISQNHSGSKLDIAASILGIPQSKGSGDGRHVLLLRCEACSRKSNQFYYSKQHEWQINDPNETVEDLDYYMLIAWTYLFKYIH